MTLWMIGNLRTVKQEWGVCFFFWCYECLQILGLFDLGVTSPQFTWNRRRGGTLFRRTRLDQAMASVEWCTLFLNASLHTLANSVSDHTLILLNTAGTTFKGCKPFKFKAIYANDIRSHWVIKRVWNSVFHQANGKRLVKRIRETRDAICKWNKERGFDY